MEHVFKHEQLPSGKVIVRHYGEDGALVEEQHTYGTLDIGISYAFKAGTKIDETYFATRRMVSRRTYEKARTAYADMPGADGTLQDAGAELLTRHLIGWPRPGAVTSMQFTIGATLTVSLPQRNRPGSQRALKFKHPGGPGSSSLPAADQPKTPARPPSLPPSGLKSQTPAPAGPPAGYSPAPPRGHKRKPPPDPSC